MKADEFQCFKCKRIFKQECSDGEAEKELEKNFNGQFITEDCEVVYDDCYKEMGFGK